MERIVFADSWQVALNDFGLKSFNDFFGLRAEETVNKNNKREVIKFEIPLGGATPKKQVFFMKRFFNPHFKDMLFTRRAFGRFVSQARCEWENINLLTASGIETYKSICYGEQTSWGIERKCFIVTEELQGVAMTDFVGQKWRRLRYEEKKKLIADLGRFVRRIHDLNISLPDLYLWHIFIKEDARPGPWEFAVIDLHRMSHNVKNRNQQIKNLGRLDHSMLDKYFDETMRRLFVESYAGQNYPGGVEKLAQKVKKYSNAASAKRNQKPY